MHQRLRLASRRQGRVAKAAVSATSARRDSSHIFALLFDSYRQRIDSLALAAFGFVSLLTISQGAQRSCGWDGVVRRIAQLIHKRRNAADRPQRPLPEGLSEIRDWIALRRLHGHGPMLRNPKPPLSRLRANAIPLRP